MKDAEERPRSECHHFMNQIPKKQYMHAGCSLPIFKNISFDSLDLILIATHIQFFLSIYRLSTTRVAHPVLRVSASTRSPFGTSFSSALLVACSSVLPVLT